MSEICLGTMYFGHRVEVRTSVEILDRFVDAGEAFLEIAKHYPLWGNVTGDGRGALIDRQHDVAASVSVR